MVLKIFFLGVIITLPAILIEFGLEEEFNILSKAYAFISPVYLFMGLAFVEEFLKYLVVREKVLKNSEFDEPVDVMLYMIIAALGFAALENVLVLMPKETPLLLTQTAAITAFRFLGATFLHALCSGLVGYFLALSFFNIKNKLRLTVLGLIIATILHGLFNLSIMRIDKTMMFANETTMVVNSSILTFMAVFLIILLGSMAIAVLLGFKKVKKLTSICKVNPRTKEPKNP